VALDIATHTVMHALPREVDPAVFHMSSENPGDVTFGDIGGLGDQIGEIREIVELPLTNPGIFKRVGIPPPKGALLYGPPGTGKTLIARAIARNTKANFLKVVATSLFDRYVGESARVVREMFAYANEHQPCIIFIDEVDALGGRRLEEGSSTDREVQRTLMELLAQMDGFASTSQVKVVMATNRPDVLDPALLRPGRLDRKIEIPLPNEQARYEILKIHAKGLTIAGDVDFDAVVKLSEGFNGADLRNVCTEAGMFALRSEKDAITNEDFMKAVRTVKQAKGLETTLHYEKI
jgi:26S proteasome regulatory subunit T4